MKKSWLVILMVMGFQGIASAQLLPPRSADPGSPRSNELASRSAEALAGGRATDALGFAERAISSDAKNPWSHYDRAAALGELGRVDEAVTEFKAAEERFSSANAWGKSIAIFGEANVLERSGRCVEAARQFERYAQFVERSDPQSAALARTYATGCQSRSSR